MHGSIKTKAEALEGDEALTELGSGPYPLKPIGVMAMALLAAHAFATIAWN